METWVTILCAALGSTGLFAFIMKLWDTLAQRRREKKDKPTKQEQMIRDINIKLDSLINRMDKLEEQDLEQERNGVRTQLILLFKLCPERSDEIFTVAKKYFIDLNGNSYIKNLFEDWCKQNDEQLPDWYKEKFNA